MAVKKIAGSEITKVAAAADRLSLVDFSATWCGPCKMLDPVLEKVSEEMAARVSVFRIDVDENQMESTKYGIRGVPTMIVFHKGVEIDRMVGFRDKGALVNHLGRIADDKLGV